MALPMEPVEPQSDAHFLPPAVPTTTLLPAAARRSLSLILYAEPSNGFSLFAVNIPLLSPYLRLSLPSLLQPFAVVWMCQDCFWLRPLLFSLPGMLSPQITTQLASLLLLRYMTPYH